MTTYICNPKTGRAIEFGGSTYKKINKMPKWPGKLARFPKSSSKKGACQVCGINAKTNRCNRNFSHNQPHLCKLGPKGWCRKVGSLESIVEEDDEDDEWFPEEGASGEVRWRCAVGAPLSSKDEMLLHEAKAKEEEKE